jgi:hypothetical protein
MKTSGWEAPNQPLGADSYTLAVHLYRWVIQVFHALLMVWVDSPSRL